MALHPNSAFIIENVRDSVCSSSDGLVARLAVPDTNGVTLDSGLSTEGADVFGVLCDFHLLDLLSQRSTVSVKKNQDQPYFLSDLNFCRR
jgi:hypothetical protein